jgi:hypothetical protein
MIVGTTPDQPRKEEKKTPAHRLKNDGNNPLGSQNKESSTANSAQKEHQIDPETELSITRPRNTYLQITRHPQTQAKVQNNDKIFQIRKYIAFLQQTIQAGRGNHLSPPSPNTY